MVFTSFSAQAKSYIRDYTYTANAIDTKESCQILVLDHMKKILLQEIGTHIRHKISITEDGKGNSYAREDVEALTAGFTKSIILEEKWDGKKYYIKAALEADESRVLNALKEFKKDNKEKKELISKLKSNQEKLKLARNEVDNLKQQLKLAKTEQQKQSIVKQYKKQIQNITRLDMYNKALDYEEAGKHKQAVYWYKKAADNGRGILGAMINLGNHYRTGKGIDKNPTKAAYWYQKAAERNMEFGQFNLGLMYYQGDGIPQDYSQALYWWKKAANNGHDEASYNLGTMYQEGIGVEKDMYQAFQLHKKAAEMGISGAQHNIAVMYFMGKGVEKNQYIAHKWFVKAAEQKHLGSQLQLVRSYFNGHGVKKDSNKGIFWAKKAAKNGDIETQVFLGELYRLGFAGVQVDIEQAKFWYQKAAQNGNQMAINKLKKLN